MDTSSVQSVNILETFNAYRYRIYKLDSNAAGHSVDSDIFYAVICLSAGSKTYSNLYFSK